MASRPSGAPNTLPAMAPVESQSPEWLTASNRPSSRLRARRATYNGTANASSATQPSPGSGRTASGAVPASANWRAFRSAAVVSSCPSKRRSSARTDGIASVSVRVRTRSNTELAGPQPRPFQTGGRGESGSGPESVGQISLRRDVSAQALVPEEYRNRGGNRRKHQEIGLSQRSPQPPRLEASHGRRLVCLQHSRTEIPIALDIPECTSYDRNPIRRY